MISKGGLIAFTRALAAQGRGVGVRANCVAPGLVATPFARRALTDGAIGFVKFSAARGSNLYLTLTDPAGKPLPFGASVQDVANGKELGIVGEGGAAFLTQFQPKSTLAVRAGERTLCTIDALPNQLQLEGTPIPVTCQTPGESHAAAARVER